MTTFKIRLEIAFLRELLMLNQVVQPSLNWSHCCSCARVTIFKIISEEEEGLQALALHFVNIIRILFVQKKNKGKKKKTKKR